MFSCKIEVSIFFYGAQKSYSFIVETGRVMKETFTGSTNALGDDWVPKSMFKLMFTKMT